MVRLLESISEWSGRATAWLATILVATVVTNVVLRYFFANSQIWLSELSWHLYAGLFLLGGAYALKHGSHVRVDVFYSKWSVKGKAVVNLLGTLLFLIPFCIMGIVTALPFFSRSWKIGETSPEPGGLPARWFIKGIIVLAFGLLLVQALAELIKAAQTLFSKLPQA